MKSPNHSLHSEEFHAKKAVQQIQKWIEKKYPRITAAVKTKMILECLIELSEERKFKATQC